MGALGELVTGEVIEAGAPGYDAARRPALARFGHIRPRAVVRCASVDDVARTLDFAHATGLHVVPRGGGHCFAGRSSTDGIVLDLTPLRSIAVSPDGVATIGAGATLAEVYGALHEHGLTLPAGCGPTVGIAGLTLGGGLGILGRKYGLTCDRLRAAQVALADGRILDCDEHRDADLFWALRGAGGGQFGVVTSLVFDAVPAPDATRFELVWSLDAAAAVVAAWQDWAPDAPDEMSANLRLVAAGTDGPVEVIMFGAMLGTEAETAELLGELVGLVGRPPGSESRARLPYHDLKGSLAVLGSADAAEPEPPGLVSSRSEFFRRSLPADAITRLLEGFVRDRTAGQRRELAFTPMGGAYNRVPVDATAFVHRAERFLLEHVTVSSGGASTGSDLVPRWVQRSWAGLHPWGSGRVYPNFPDPELTDWTEAYHGSNYARLARVKRTYDPERLLHFPQSV
ncbi:MAG: FAD-binding protein [Propionibacteriales bacterium]|nr:FAD-binding protein [Propionibacteriales bacterium]